MRHAAPTSPLPGAIPGQPADEKEGQPADVEADIKESSGPELLTRAEADVLAIEAIVDHRDSVGKWRLAVVEKRILDKVFLRYEKFDRFFYQRTSKHTTVHKYLLVFFGWSFAGAQIIPLEHIKSRCLHDEFLWAFENTCLEYLESGTDVCESAFELRNLCTCWWSIFKKKKKKKKNMGRLVFCI